VRPSGANATDHTQLLWPVRGGPSGWGWAGSVRSHSMVSVELLVASTRPPGENTTTLTGLTLVLCRGDPSWRGWVRSVRSQRRGAHTQLRLQRGDLRVACRSPRTSRGHCAAPPRLPAGCLARRPSCVAHAPSPHTSRWPAKKGGSSSKLYWRQVDGPGAHVGFCVRTRPRGWIVGAKEDIDPQPEGRGLFCAQRER
jgi:hypothetical protein